jgi:site-specific DNA recombinase
MHGIKVLMAKNYVDNLSEETRKGMFEKAEQGIWPSFAPLGYRNVDGRMVRKLSHPIPMSSRSSPSCSTGTRPVAFL